MTRKDGYIYIMNLLESLTSLELLRDTAVHGDKPAAGYIEADIMWGNDSQAAMFGGTSAMFVSRNMLTVFISIPRGLGVGALYDNAELITTAFRSRVIGSDINFISDNFVILENSGAPFIRGEIRLVFEMESYKPMTEIGVEAVISGVLTVTQAAHGLAVWDWVGYDGSNWSKVAANGTHPKCQGVVMSTYSANSFCVCVAGILAGTTAHGYTLGPLWLSQTSAGDVVYSEQPSGYVQRVGTAVSAFTVLVEQNPQAQK